MSSISNYSKHKILVAMTKPRSAFSIYFTIEDPNDDWLINVVKFKTKTGEITFECMIIKPDLERRVESYEEDGFVKV